MGFPFFHVVSLFLTPAVSYLLYAQWVYRKRSKGLSLPPGPKGWPFIGNVLDIPLASMGPVYARWTKSFGSDIVSANALGTTLVILDSYDTAVELLEKRASKYSSRPVSVLACDVMGWNCIFVLLPYSEAWKERRRLFTRYFRSPGHSDAALGTVVHASQVYEFVHRFLLDLNDTPGEVYGLARHMIGSLAISLAYGLPVQRRRDETVEFVDSMARLVAELVTPGSAIVDVIPALNYIPESIPIPFSKVEIPIPGMGWKRYAKSVRWMAVKFKAGPYERAVNGFGTEGVRPSFTSDALAELDANGPSEEARQRGVDAIQDAASTIFGTAGDTTTHAVLASVFALATHPSIRHKIQDELDSLLVEVDEAGKRILRLPTFEDQDRLPLLMAAVMESQRWAPVTPIGFPHRTTEDDVYKGYFIPKGSVIVANQWSMLNNPEEYGEDVLEYNPERFIRPKKGAVEGKTVEVNPEIRHPARIAFGFGRRACPGSHVAQSALWLTTACLLTVFDFDAPDVERPKYIGADGMVDPTFDPGFLCHPKKFRCEFKVRSEEARILLGELGMSV